MEVFDGAEAVFGGADRGQASGGGEVPGAGLVDRPDVQAVGDSGQTFFRWRIKYGALKEDEAQRLKALEQENSRLKRIVADQALDIAMLRDLQRGKW
jgi:hypothetical protein